MSVQGYLSLYTMLLGWQQYDALWSIMIATGLFYLPFVYIVAKNWLQPLLSQEPKSAAVISVRRIIVGLVMGLTILCVAGIPTVSVDPTVLHYQPVCEQSAKVATPGNTGTTYDNIPVPTGVTMPLLWYVVLALSNGITDAAISGLSCPTVNLRDFQNELDLSSVQDPQLKAETQSFYTQCYLPAYSKYMNAAGTDSELENSIQQAKSKYGQDDVGWMGSSILITVPGLYNSIQASQPVAKFPFDPSRDAIDDQVDQKPLYGEPMCDEWWTDPQYGLRQALFNQLTVTAQAQVESLEEQYPQTGVPLQDAVIRAILEKSFQGMGFIDRNYSSEEDDRSGYDDKAAMVAAKVFTVKAALSEYPKLHILINALPIIQAVLLFGIFVLLALALPLSGYSIGFCFTASVMLFSVTFCSYLWHLVTWLDNYLLQALYGGTTSTDNWVRNFVSNTLSPGRILTDLIVSVFYIVLPLFWLGMTGWAGVSGGGALNSLSGSHSNDLGSKVGNSTSTAAGGAAKAVGSFIAKS